MGVILRYNDLLKSYKTRGHRLKRLEEFKPLFPLQSSPLLSGIVGDLFGDGNLQGEPKWRLDFTSKYLEDLNYFNQRIACSFNIVGKIRRCKTNKLSVSHNLGINCAPLARTLKLIGVPSGEKVKQIFEIPNWIKEDKECFREFCKEFFTCEASIMNEKKRKTPQIRLEQWKVETLLQSNPFMKELKENMKSHFQIESSITFPKAIYLRKDGLMTKPARIYILNDNVRRFFDEIGFSNWKQKSLKAMLVN